jgi:hypothetical protein
LALIADFFQIQTHPSQTEFFFCERPQPTEFSIAKDEEKQVLLENLNKMSFYFPMIKFKRVPLSLIAGTNGMNQLPAFGSCFDKR